MGLSHTISEWIRVIKDTFDFGPEFPAAVAGQPVRTPEDVTQLQQQLEDARQACREKDELIAQLQAALPMAPVADLRSPAEESVCEALPSSEVPEPQPQGSSPAIPPAKTGRKRGAASARPRAARQLVGACSPSEEAKPVQPRRRSPTRPRAAKS